MKNIGYVFFFFFLISCKIGNKNKVVELPVVEELTKLEKLFLLPQDSAMDYYDLSNDSIVAFPDLSGYIIKSLNLSGNLLDTLVVDFLPQKIENLNLSHNHYKARVYIGENAIPFLKELDFSYNSLSSIGISEPLYRIILSHNNLSTITLNHKNIQYLDVSYNSNLAERVDFDPSKIDTIVRDGVADGKRLISKMRVGIIDDDWGDTR
ncbi:hypothetical protein [Bacteroides bouchesdurhonensis]|uniref:hypothetical protein n=1 Tax=Bacteroides bouchesdurhonensis TaxID=1841855 RepID=UPI0022E21F46|nr:hypothetical protein [Bacteroides bouchesdurhonensis]